MNTKKIEIEGKKSTFEYDNCVFLTNVYDVRRFIIWWIRDTYDIKFKHLKLLSKSICIYLYKNKLKQKIEIVVTFTEVESKANFNPLFNRINTYKAYINDTGFEMVKTALNALETKINK